MSAAWLLLAALAASPDAGTLGGYRNPVSITADKLEVLNKKGQAIYTGHVKAVRGTMHITCGRLIATYGANNEITQVECLGGAELTDRDRWAKGDRAVLETEKNVVEVTGNPQMRQGPNQMKGERVFFDLGKDTIEVEHPVATFEMAAKPASAKVKGKADAGTKSP